MLTFLSRCLECLFLLFSMGVNKVTRNKWFQ